MYENYHVLFVDDEENILRSLKRGLIDEEFQCHFAIDGEEALELMEKWEIAVIVSDMRMPGMDGVQLLRKVRDCWPRTIRVVLSGYVQLVQVLMAVNEVGISGFLTKPWRLEEEFRETIHRALDEYIRVENEEHETKKQEAQSAMFRSLVQKMALQNRYYKKGIVVLAEISKAMAEFDQAFPDFDTISNRLERRMILLNLFRDAVLSKREDYHSSMLTEQYSRFMESLFHPITMTKLTEQKITVHTSFRMVEAIIEAARILFYEEFAAFGASARIGVEVNGVFCPYLATEYHETDTQKTAMMDYRLSYFSKALAHLSTFGLTCFTERYGSKFVICVFINQ